MLARQCAAQLTSAGAVSERKPAMIPMEKHPRYRTALLTSAVREGGMARPRSIARQHPQPEFLEIFAPRITVHRITFRNEHHNKSLLSGRVRALD
jgi:hypothetical protein